MFKGEKEFAKYQEAVERAINGARHSATITQLECSLDKVDEQHILMNAQLSAIRTRRDEDVQRIVYRNILRSAFILLCAVIVIGSLVVSFVTAFAPSNSPASSLATVLISTCIAIVAASLGVRTGLDEFGRIW